LRWPSRTRADATGSENNMLIDYWLGALTSLALAGYLVYALLVPEDF
jgi:K+-transporting ATPase KdpF subunit